MQKRTSSDDDLFVDGSEVEDIKEDGEVLLGADETGAVEPPLVGTDDGDSESS